MSRLTLAPLLLGAALLAAGAPVVAAAEPAAGGASPETAPRVLPVPDGFSDTAAAAIDGGIVVGSASSRDAGAQAIAWDVGQDPARIIKLGSPHGSSRATAVSGALAAGSAVVADGGPAVPVVWQVNGGSPEAQPIGDDDDVVAGLAGTMAVGSVTDGDRTSAVAWDLSDLDHPVRIDLDRAGTYDYSAASAISGTTVVGVVLDGWTYRAASWDLSADRPEAQLLDTSDADSIAYGVGGRLAAGYRDTGDGWKATTWDLAHPGAPVARDLGAETGSAALASSGRIVAGYTAAGAVAWEYGAAGPVAHPLAAGPGTAASAAAISGRTVAGTVTDRHDTSRAVTWSVGIGSASLDGLLAPVARGGTINTVHAGQVVPLRFRIHAAGDMGLDVAGLRARVSSTVVACPDGAARSVVAEDVQQTRGVDAFGDGLYRVTWGAGAALGSSCREVTVTVESVPAGMELRSTSMTALFEVVP